MEGKAGLAEGGGDGKVRQQVQQAALHLQHPQGGQQRRWWQRRQDVGLIANAYDSHSRKCGTLARSVGGGGRINHSKDNNSNIHTGGGECPPAAMEMTAGISEIHCTQCYGMLWRAVRELTGHHQLTRGWAMQEGCGGHQR